MAYGYIKKLSRNVEKIPFNKLEIFFKEYIKWGKSYY